MIQDVKRAFKGSPFFPLYCRYIRPMRIRWQMHQQLNQWAESDERRMSFYRQFIKPGDLVFDIGANAGNRVKIFIRLGARVVAVEPQKICADFLESAFKDNPNFILLRKALGPEPGQGTIFVSKTHTISTMSAEWITAVRESGRFAKEEWDTEEVVAMDTLDNLIAEFGEPSFIKIDVEGYEYAVLSGLSRPVKAVSLEFTPEHLESAYNCIDHMVHICDTEFQISLGESMTFYLSSWIGPSELKDALRKIPPRKFGDIYARRTMNK